MKKYVFIIVFLCLCFTSVLGQVNRSTVLKNGLYCQMRDGLLKIEFITPDIVRTQYTKEDAFLGNQTTVCIDRSEQKVRFDYLDTNDYYVLKSDSLVLKIDKTTTGIAYYDVNGKLLLEENQSTPRTASKVLLEKVSYDKDSKRTEVTANGKIEVMDVARRDEIGYTWRYRMQFHWQEKEALYGLGSHMEDYMNLRGKELYLVQHNLKAMVPVLNSTAGYGLLFDAGCGMVYKDTEEGSFVELDAAKQIDYYFMKGINLDAVVANYRFLTGEVPMMPRYLFGYIQSKERYHSSEEIINIVSEYRRRQVPLDVIVQDWNYWPDGQWGTMEMNRQFYPSPKQLAENVHKLHAKLMISIWPNMINSAQASDFANKRYLLEGRDAYDAFSPLARSLYWKYADKEFFANDFDAWWCDCTEPLDADWKKIDYDPGDQKKRWENNVRLLSDALGAEKSCIYSLFHSRGIYENQRLASNKKRVVNLTRSSYAGQQRYSTITWSGDTYASWGAFAQQIPAGLNFMATGCPYWTVDIGAFFVKNNGWQWFWAGDYNSGVSDMGYRELYTRMFQYATFLPIQRSHGTDTPREIWNFGKPGEMFYDAILDMLHLRYRLLPYIYSMAGMVTCNNYTMTRALAFDFSHDENVFDIKDQFMFGPSILVCPVVEPMYYGSESRILKNVNKTRKVYLPAGQKWIDFWTGRQYDGGREIVSEASIDRIPLFIKGGAVLPLGPVSQYSSEKIDAPWEIRIYPGKDASFTVYEDEGDNYNYERQAYSSFKVLWNDKKQTVTITEREGKYEGMVKRRTLKIIKVSNTSGIGIDEKDGSYKTVDYVGENVKIKL